MAHEVMILCGGRVIVNNIVGLRLIALLGLGGVGRFRSANGALYTCFFCNACANVRFTNRPSFWFAFRFCMPNPSGKTPRQCLGPSLLARSTSTPRAASPPRSNTAFIVRRCVHGNYSDK